MNLKENIRRILKEYLEEANKEGLAPKMIKSSTNIKTFDIIDSGKQKIKSITTIKGKNKWSESKTKLIHMVLDLGEFEEKPSNEIDGFYERIKKYLPSLKSHRCSEGKPGGFLNRIKEGTWMGHIIEHVALELQTLAGYNTGWGRTRGVKGKKGVYNVVFNYENEECGKLAAKEAFNVVNDIINNKNPQIDKVVNKLKPKTLKESIRRILKEEEDYSPAGKEITPNSIIVHKSNPMFRDKIMEEGLKVRAGECYKIYVGYGIKCKPAIFATNSTNKRAWFDTTYDDDIWFIDTRIIPDVKWYKDRHFESTKKHIVTFQDIPKEAITLKYEGTGSGDVKTWSKDSPNLYESIRRILREDMNIPTYIKRRLYVVDEYISNLNPDDVCKYWSRDEVNEYVSGFMAEIVREILYDIPDVDPDEYGEMFDEIYGILIDLGYRKKIRDFFYESLQNCDPKHRMRFTRP